MFAPTFFILLTISVALPAITSASDQDAFEVASTECSKQFSTSIEELKMNKGTETYYCFLKCLNENLGMLRSNGIFDLDQLRKCPNVQKLEVKDQAELIECVGHLGKIVNCSDMKGLTDCFSHAKSLDLNGLL